MNLFITGIVIGFLIGLLAGRWVEQTKEERDNAPTKTTHDEYDDADWWKNGKEEDYTD